AAKALGGDVHVLVAGKDCGPAAQGAAKLDGGAKVLVAEGDALAHQLAEPPAALVGGLAGPYDGLGAPATSAGTHAMPRGAALVVGLAGPYDVLVAPATSTGKNVMPRVAALLDVMQVSDVTAVLSPDTFERPICAGNAVETVQSGDAKKVVTVRASAFKPAEA